VWGKDSIQGPAQSAEPAGSVSRIRRRRQSAPLHRSQESIPYQQFLFSPNKLHPNSFTSTTVYKRSVIFGGPLFLSFFSHFLCLRRSSPDACPVWWGPTARCNGKGFTSRPYRDPTPAPAGVALDRGEAESSRSTVAQLLGVTVEWGESTRRP
jgi:hypothetical protein